MTELPPGGSSVVLVSGDTLALALGDNEAHSRRVGTAYLLLAIGGLVGAHRFYVKRQGTAIALLVLSLTGAGLIVSIPWVIVDLFLLAGYVTECNHQIRAQLLADYGVLQATQVSDTVSPNVQKATSDFSLSSRDVGTAYLLLLLAGLFGAHRFYIGSKGVGATLAILTITGGGLIVSVPWVVVDAFLLAGRVDAYNDAVKRRVAQANGIPVA